MEPENYFPEIYLDDLIYFIKTSSNKSLDLCPLLLGEQLLGQQLRNGGYAKYVSIEDFFTCHYCMNLISQGIHSYSPEFYIEWREKIVDYLNIQGCHAHSFGNGGSRPIDLVNFLHKFDVEIDELQIGNYIHHFLYEVLQPLIPEFPVADLVENLMLDPDCEEIHSDLLEISKARDIYFSRHPQS